MPLVIESAPDTPEIPRLRERRVRHGSVRDRGKRLRVGFVNNMPDSAALATEGQFARLIDQASGEFDIHLTLATLETLPRDPEARANLAQRYRSPKQLRRASLDAIIVTGAEPRAEVLSQEPFWAELTALMDWSRGGLVSALYSCLAAHAATLHRDGIIRRKLIRKLSGVYESEIAVEHELTEGLTRALTPHSRHNALAECDLESRGYLILSRSSEAGADVFIKDEDLLEVFWQGHPEYDADTLAREFRRDMLRFLKGERPKAPHAPANYFSAETLVAIDAALRSRDAASLERVAAALAPESVAPAEASWRRTAATLMGNWLGEIARRKAQGQSLDFATVRFGG